MSRPRPGNYVYSFFGLGQTSVPQGTELVERVSVSGDEYTIDITNNLNANTRRVRLRWEANRVLQLSNETVIQGQRRSCTFDPPLEILHIPIKAETFETQTSEAELCPSSTDIRVVGRERIEDVNNRIWTTWIIEMQMLEGDRVTTDTHWLSPELGRDVRIESRVEGPNPSETGQLLKASPAP